MVIESEDRAKVTVAQLEPSWFDHKVQFVGTDPEEVV